VSNPKVPASSKSYPHFGALSSAVDEVMTMMRTPQGAQNISDQLTPFLVSHYYYMFDYFNYSFANRSGATGYQLQMVGASGMIRGGFGGTVGQVELVLGE
jgi:hypothetical protein